VTLVATNPNFPNRIFFLLAGWALNPHNLFSLIRHFYTAPLAVITCNNKHHVIVNYSFPHNNKISVVSDDQPLYSPTKTIFDPAHTLINTIIDS
jgi:hypothetical protein